MRLPRRRIASAVNHDIEADERDGVPQGSASISTKSPCCEIPARPEYRTCSNSLAWPTRPARTASPCIHGPMSALFGASVSRLLRS